MNQQATQNQTFNDATMPSMCNKCKIALSNLVDRFLSSGIEVEYKIDTQMLKKTVDGTWQRTTKAEQDTATPAEISQPQKGMTKQGSIQIGSLDLVVGMLAVCLISGLCMSMHCVKRMFH